LANGRRGRVLIIYGTSPRNQIPYEVSCFLASKHRKSALGREEGFEQSEIRENRGHGVRKVVRVLEEVPDTLLK